ncbi:MAG: zinc chelation protein SecC [Anaerolineae bacterium]|nr:zinc chelation protein SecC [Anaerolineae bacterium]
MNTKINPKSKCLCHSGDEYQACCRPYHRGEALPPTPEKLMRSRYAAYALNLADYLILTTHPDSPYQQDPKTWRESIRKFYQKTRFADLQILDAEANTVTFYAILFEEDQDVSYIEQSLFRQHEGRWKYVSGKRLGG